jgi:hypothetical protein
MAEVPVLLHQGPYGLRCGAGSRVFPQDAFMKGLAVLKSVIKGKKNTFNDSSYQAVIDSKERE